MGEVRSSSSRLPSLQSACRCSGVPFSSSSPSVGSTILTASSSSLSAALRRLLYSEGCGVGTELTGEKLTGDFGGVVGTSKKLSGVGEITPFRWS